MTPKTCQVARAVLGWSQADLAKKSKVNRRTIQDFETGARVPLERTLDNLEMALKEGGVIIRRDGKRVFCGWEEDDVSG